MTTTTQTMTPEEAKTRAAQFVPEPTSTSPVVDAVAALDHASDQIALFGLTVTGMLSLGTAFAPDEARGALAMLEAIQADLDEAKDMLRQGLDTRAPKIPAAA